MQRPRALLSWSSGKDSAHALSVLRAGGEFEVAGLLTTVNESAGRVAMHAVRDDLLTLQGAAAGLPIRRVSIPSPCPNDVYELAMRAAVEQAAGDGITHIAFGDLFLEDIRAWREERLRGTGLQPVFPLWGRDTRELAEEMITAGVRAVVTCVDPRQIPAEFAGCAWDRDMLARLPPSADPCGERGEFHTFAWAAPCFTAPVAVRTGETVTRDGFVFTDLLSTDAAHAQR